MERVNSLQAGRGIAALAVVAHHANLAAHDFGSFSVPVLNYGWLGVDFFFVLSGFIITWSAPGKTAAQFAWHRFRRVVLPYLPIGIAIALLYTRVPRVSAGNRDWSWLATLTLAPVNARPALSVAWTLQHEMLFYALFLAFWFTGRFKLGLSLWAISICAGLLFHSDWLALNPLNFEFMFGVAACWAVRKQLGDWHWTVACLVPLTLWLALGMKRELSPLVGLAIAFALPALVRAEQEGKFEVHPWLIFFGTVSYSIYLAHGLVISLAARVLPLLPITMAAGVIGGISYYFAVERPILRGIRSHRSPRRRVRQSLRKVLERETSDDEPQIPRARRVARADVAVRRAE